MGILGLGIGSIDVSLNKTTFYPGEKLEGTVTLRLNEQVKARGVFVQFVASMQKGKHTKILFSSEKTLDKDRVYTPEETPKNYTFEFDVPSGIISENNFNPDLVGSLFTFLQDLNNNSIRWFLVVNLDVPLSFDVSKTVQIFVRKRPLQF